MVKSNAIANIISSQWDKVLLNCNTHQIRLLYAIGKCRTAHLGGHLYQCSNCKALHHRYNSCRNRHCPQCQNTQKQKWILAQQQKLIECPYFHIVFTIPAELNEICLAYPRRVYSILSIALGKL